MPKKPGWGDRSWIDDLPPDEILALEKGATDGPSLDELPLHIGYSVRAPGDFVLSGPLGAGTARGRHFNTIDDARAWLLGRFPGRIVGDVQWIPSENNPRWWALIRRPTP